MALDEAKRWVCGRCAVVLHQSPTNKNKERHYNGIDCKVRMDHLLRTQRGLGRVSMAMKDLLEDHGIPGEQGMRNPRNSNPGNIHIDPNSGQAIDREACWFVPAWAATLCNLGLHRDHLSKWLIRCKKDPSLFSYVEILLSMAQRDPEHVPGAVIAIPAQPPLKTSAILRQAMYELERAEQSGLPK